MNFFHKIPIFFWSWFYPCTIHGKDNIPKDGACVLVCNHYRAIDCGFVARAYNKDAFFLAKKELFKNKLVAKLIKSYGAIPIDRDKPDIKSMLMATKVLKEGHKLVVFPEGTRNKTQDDLMPLKPGSVVFAVRAKCPVVPLMLSGKSRIFRRTHLIVGKPFEFSEFYDKKLSNEDIQAMDEILREKMLEQAQLLKSKLNKKKTKNNVSC